MINILSINGLTLDNKSHEILLLKEHDMLTRVCKH